MLQGKDSRAGKRSVFRCYSRQNGQWSDRRDRVGVRAKRTAMYAGGWRSREEYAGGGERKLRPRGGSDFSTRGSASALAQSWVVGNEAGGGMAQKQVAVAPIQAAGTSLLHTDLAGHGAKLVFPLLWQRRQ